MTRGVTAQRLGILAVVAALTVSAAMLLLIADYTYGPLLASPRQGRATHISSTELQKIMESEILAWVRSSSRTEPAGERRRVALEKDSANRLAIAELGLNKVPPKTIGQSGMAG